MKFYLCSLIFLSFAFTLWADIPKTISYQGILKDNDGVPVTDNDYVITFTIFNQQTSGTQLWTENHSVHTENGLFSVILGSLTPLELAFNSKYWLGTSVNGTSMNTRTEFTTSPYSFYAKKAANSDSLAGLPSSYYRNWTYLQNVPSYLTDGDQIGLASLDGVSCESGNIDLIGDGIGIVSDNVNKTITLTATSTSPNFKAGQAMLLLSQNYDVTIPTNLGRIPKKVEITIKNGVSMFSQAKWLDENQDGMGVSTIVYSYMESQPNPQYSKTSCNIESNSASIGLLQSGVSDGQEFVINTSANTIRIHKGNTYGSPSLGNIIVVSWFVE